MSWQIHSIYIYMCVCMHAYVCLIKIYEIYMYVCVIVIWKGLIENSVLTSYSMSLSRVVLQWSWSSLISCKVTASVLVLSSCWILCCGFDRPAVILRQFVVNSFQLTRGKTILKQIMFLSRLAWCQVAVWVRPNVVRVLWYDPELGCNGCTILV